MATADKLSYLLETKNKIKDSINQDFNTITDDTPFREYANALNDNIDKLKEFIPTNVVSGKEIVIEDAVPLKLKTLKINGNSHQESTKGYNLFNYKIIIPSVNGVTTILNDDGSITTTGKITANYGTVVNRTDITDILENEQNYTLFQSNPNPYIYIQLRRQNLYGTWEYIYSHTEDRINFNADKTNYTYYEINVQTGLASNWGDEERVITQKYMLYKGTEELEWEPYTGGMASHNSDYPQNIETIDVASIQNNNNTYNIDLQNNKLIKINDISDELDFITGILNKKIGLKVLNGTENWVSTSAYEGYYRYSLEPIDENLKSNSVIGVYSLNTHFYDRNKENHGNYEYLYVQANGVGGIIYIQSKKWASVEEFKEWLSNNNVIVCYQLITPQTIQLEPINIKMCEGTNNIKLVSNLETEMQLEYYKDYKANSLDEVSE